jgi:hypothetical protein
MRNGLPTHTTQTLNITVISNEACTQYYSGPNGPLEAPLSVTRVCEAGVDNQGPCHGDSGGPLYATKDGRDWWVMPRCRGFESCEIPEKRGKNDNAVAGSRT